MTKSNIEDLINKYKKSVKWIAKGIAATTGMNQSDLESPGLEGLWRGAEFLSLHEDTTKNSESYMNASIRNSILDFVRKERHYGFTEVSEDDAIPTPISLSMKIDSEDETDQTLADTISDHSTDLTELKREISERIDRLPALYRPVFRLKLNDATLSDQEIADILHVPIKMVQNHIFTGRKYF